MDTTAFVLAIAISLFIIRLVRTRKIKSDAALPQQLPGPFGLPYVGSPWQIPPSTNFLGFQALAKKHGPIYQLEIMGEKLVVISSKSIQESFLLKHNTKFTSRPHFPSVTGTGRDIIYMPLMTSSPAQRLSRKIGTQALNAIPKDLLLDTTHRVAREYVAALLKDPDDAKVLTEVFLSRITCEISWADPGVAHKNTQIAWKLVRAVSPGSALLSKLPFLAQLWDRLPDACQPWKTYELRRRAEEVAFWTGQEQRAPVLARRQQQQQRDRNQAADPKADEKAGDSDPSEPRWTMAAEVQRLYKQHAGEDFGGVASSDLTGILTVIGSLLLCTPVQTYLIAMAANANGQEWQAKLAEELSEVLGAEDGSDGDGAAELALPTPADLPRLPVLRAVVREVLRWRPPVPNNAPRVCESGDQLYRDARTGREFAVPRGAGVIYHAWSLERDPLRFPDPDAFRPERWLDPSWPSYRGPLAAHPRIADHPGFGWGSRACIGVDYVETVVCAVVAALARSLVVRKSTDPATGRPLDINTLDYEPFTLFVRPRPWPMTVLPRERAR